MSYFCQLVINPKFNNLYLKVVFHIGKCFCARQIPNFWQTFHFLGLYYKYGALMDDVTQPGIHWMQPFVTEMKALRLTPETEIMNPMVCTTRDGVRNVFRDVQVSF